MTDIEPAATVASDAPPVPAIAETAADDYSTVAASDDDEIAQLKSDYQKNLLEPEESEPEEQAAEPEEEPAAEPAEEPEDDLLVEPSGPRDLEALKKQFPRSQTTVLQELEKVEKDKWAAIEQVNKLGGEIGVGIANEVMPLLLKASPTEQDGDALLEHLFVTNAPLGIEMSKLLLDKAFSEDSIDPETNLPIRVATANAMIKKHISDKHDLGSIEELVEFDNAGLIDREELRKDLESGGESEAVKALKAEVAELKGVKDREEAAKKTEAQKQAQVHYQKATGHVTQTVMDSLIPLAERYGWTATKEELASDKPEVKELAQSKVAMGEFLTAWLNQRVRQLPEWAAVEHLARSGQALSEDGKPTHLFTVNSTPLRNKIMAEFKERVAILNRTFAKSFASSRNNQLKKTIQKRPASTVIPEVRTETPKPTDDFSVARDAAVRQYRESMKQVTAG